MPLSTFYNLNENRKNAIIRIAYEEFAFNSYQAASVSNIVKKLEIAKGSFYRYFTNKADLFSFLLEKIAEKRMRQLNAQLENGTTDFFKILRENFRDRFTFGREHPVESIFLINALRENNAHDVKPAIDNYKKEILLFISSLVIVFQKKGDIKRDVSAEMAAHFIYQTQLGIYEYLTTVEGVDFNEIVQAGRTLPLTEDQFMEVTDEMLAIIKSGLEIK